MQVRTKTKKKNMRRLTYDKESKFTRIASISRHCNNVREISLISEGSDSFLELESHLQSSGQVVANQQIEIADLQSLCRMLSRVSDDRHFDISFFPTIKRLL